ncbi:hypothetical protein Tco_1252216 [Tanacetum coccineum]
MVGNSIYTVTSVLTQKELDLHCATYGISADLRPELPDRNAIIKDSPPGKIGMHTRFVEFANFLIGAAKVSHFELMCRAVGRVPTADTFRCFYVNSLSNGWLSFSKHSGADDPCCVSKKFDSLKNWNNHFFWIDALVFLLSIPWFDGVSIIKDPLPVKDAVDLLCVKLLNVNRIVIRKYPETFLFLVGLSRSFTHNNVRPTLLRDDEKEMGLFDFVKSADPFKVKTDERTLAKDELKVNNVKKKKRVAFVVGSPLVKRARTMDVAVSDTRPATAGKSPMALRRLIKQGVDDAAGSGSAAPATEDFVSSFVTPISEHEYQDGSDHSDNVRTCPPSGRFTILSSSSADTDIPASPQVVQSATDAVELEGEVRGTSAPETVIYVPHWNVTNGVQMDHPIIFHNFLDHLTPPGYWASLRNQSNARFLKCFNINSAQHTSMVSELRLRFEHKIMSREKFEKKFTESAAIIQQRDAEIADLKVKLEKDEREVAEVIALRQHVSELEAAATAKASKVVALIKQNVELSGKVSALELVHGELDVKVSELTADYNSLRSKVMGETRMQEEFKSIQDAAAQRLDERVAEPDGRLADVKHDMDDHLYPHMFTAIVGRGWVIGHGLLLAVYKCARSVECHTTMGQVISMVINKCIQEGLKARIEHGKEGRDSSLTLIMSALTLKDDHGDVDSTPSFKVIPSVRGSAESMGLCSPSGSTPTASLGVSNYHISMLAQPHDDLFNTGVLDKPADA